MAASARNWHRINVWPNELTAEDASRDQSGAGAKQLKRLSVYPSTTAARANTAWVPIGRGASRRPAAKPAPEPETEEEPHEDERTVPRHQRERDKR